jgi:hypothetical protein
VFILYNMKQFTLSTSYFIEPDLEANVCLRPSDPQISDYIASFFTFENEEEAFNEIPILVVEITSILFNKFQEMENIPIEIRNEYYL